MNSSFDNSGSDGGFPEKLFNEAGSVNTDKIGFKGQPDFKGQPGFQGQPDFQGQPGFGVEEGSEDRGGIITARGTGEGLVVRMDARAGTDNLRGALVDFMKARRGFLSGQEVILEWLGEIPEGHFVAEISDLLASEYGVSVKGSRLFERARRELKPEPASKATASSAGGLKARAAAPAQDLYSGGVRIHRRTNFAGEEPTQMPERSPSLFDGMHSINREVEVIREDDPAEVSSGAQAGWGGQGQEGAFWDEADARIVYGTLRGGQKIESEHSVIVAGDVNSGAEVIAGGDIVVLGTLRGIAHAGAYDETGGGRVIFALNLQPTQLRIGSVISRGSGESSRRDADKVQPEIARVDGTIISVEPYNSRNFSFSASGPNGYRR